MAKRTRNTMGKSNQKNEPADRHQIPGLRNKGEPMFFGIGLNCFGEIRKQDLEAAAKWVKWHKAKQG